MIRKRAELSFEIRLFLIQALENTLYQISRNNPRPTARTVRNAYSRYEIFQISDKENKSVSSVYVYVLVFYSFVCCGFCCLWVQK